MLKLGPDLDLEDLVNQVLSYVKSLHNQTLTKNIIIGYKSIFIVHYFLLSVCLLLHFYILKLMTYNSFRHGTDFVVSIIIEEEYQLIIGN